jgi:nucleotide-binding universal stress UspA family protein
MMTSPVRGDILVGFSPSAASAAALRWALAEGARLHCGVRVVHVYDASERADSRLETSMQPGVARSPRYPERVLGLLGEVADEDRVSVSELEGRLVDVLRDEANDARMVVMGEPGNCRHRGLEGRLRELVTCPVVTVPVS